MLISLNKIKFYILKITYEKFFKINNLSNKMKKLDRATNWKIINI